MHQASYHETWEISEKLNRMGLSADILQSAVETGELYRSSCTLNDPKSLAGTLAWGRAMRTLREKLIPRGWERIDILNSPMVLNRERGIAIVVSSGDEATGNAVLVAKTKYKKRRAAEVVIIKNLTQLLLPTFDIEEPTSSNTSGNDFVTWFLLVSRQGEEVFFELSLPNKFVHGQPIESWAERIIFPSFKLQGPSDSKYDDSFEEEINVEISRKM